MALIKFGEIVIDVGDAKVTFKSHKEVTAWLQEKETLYSWSDDIKQVFTNLLGQSRAH